jgi:ABC-type phosphate transport system substrate-binding protein
MTAHSRLGSRRRRLAGACAKAAILVASLPAGAASAPPSAEAIVVVVSAESAITGISRLHLADLYLGRTSRFPDGALAEPIDQESTSPDRERFYRLYLGRTLAQMKAHWSKIIFTGRGRPPKAVADGETVRELVAANPRAIGFLRRLQVDDSVRVVRID